MSGAAVAIRRKENETPEERAQRRAEKRRQVEAHRASVLKRVNQPAKESRLHKKEDFVCPVRFNNDLPDVPVEQKFLHFPFDEDFVTAYDVLHGVSSETAKPRAFHADPDLGVGIPLMDPSSYMLPPEGEKPQLHPADAYITSEEFSRPAAKKAEIVDPNKVEWVLFSQHLHNDLYDAVYKHSDAVKVQTQDFARRKAQLKAQLGDGDKQTRIEASFQACSGDAPLVHPTQPSLQPKRVWELLPDPERSAVNYVAVAFDIDPDDAQERKTRKQPALGPAHKRARLERSLLRTPAAQPVNTRENSTMVHYLLPEAEDVDPATHGLGGAAEPYHARPARDYSMVVEAAGVGAAGGEDSFAWAWDDVNATIAYAPVRARAFVTRVRDAEAEAANSVVAVSRRPLNADEEDASAEARAVLDESDPTDTLQAIQQRRAERAAQAREAARFGGAFGSSAGAGSSSAGAGAGSSGGAGAGASGKGKDEDDELSDGFDI